MMTEENEMKYEPSLAFRSELMRRRVAFLDDRSQRSTAASTKSHIAIVRDVTRRKILDRQSQPIVSVKSNAHSATIRVVKPTMIEIKLNRDENRKRQTHEFERNEC